MALVYGSGAYTGIEIGEQTVDWDTEATTMYGLAIVSDSFHVERDAFTDVEEFGTYGGRSSIETGRAYSVGEFTCIPRYDSIAWNILLAHAMGAEDVVANEHIERLDPSTAGDAAGNSHVYTFSTALPKGLTVNVWKMGDSASKLLEQYVGCLVTGFTIEQPEGDVMRMTFRFIGKKTVLTTDGGAIDTTGAGSYPFTARDLVHDATYRDEVEVKVNTDFGSDMNLRSFTLDVDKKVELSSNFITSPDTVEKPGITGTREVTLSMESFLEVVIPTDTDYPYYEFVNSTASAVNIIFGEGTDVVGSSTSRHFRIHLPALKWESGEAPLSDAGVVNLSLTGRAFMADLASGDGHFELPGVPTELRLMTYVDTADEPAGAGSDDPFSSEL